MEISRETLKEFAKSFEVLDAEESELSGDLDPGKSNRSHFPNVSVRKLEWNDDPCPAAQCVFGHYVVYPLYFHVELLLGYETSSTMTSLGRIQLPPGATIDEIKAAVQQDYEQRIFSALEPVVG